MLLVTKSCRACGRHFTGGEIFCPDDGSRLAVESRVEQAARDPLVGSTLDGRYQVVRVVGEGGMGIVYEAEHTLIDRRVALKVLRDDFSRRQDVVERFRREARSASRIGHPNIVDVLDFGVTPSGASYFVMEMLHGEDLADVLSRETLLAPTRATAIIHQCCRALAAAHHKGIVHRDLKPENIFLIKREGRPDFVKIVDFGVAKMSEIEVEAGGRRKLTRTGMIFGTPEYMSPEQAAGRQPDHRADIYALGIILYELLTGRVPFEGESFMSVLSKHASKRVPALRDVNPSVRVSRALEGVVFGALRKEPEERFASMREMAMALEAVSELPPLIARESLASAPPLSLPVPAPAAVYEPPASPSKPAPTPLSSAPPAAQARAAALPELAPRRKRSWWLPQLSLLALAAVLGAVLLWRGMGPAARAEPRALPPVSVEGVAVPRGQLGATTPTLADDGQLVMVRVTTEPAGAAVRSAAGSEVCAATPCAFEVARGEPIELVARFGAQEASATLAPRDTTDLHLVLKPAGARSEKASGAQRPAPVAAPGRRPGRDDLKVPAAFR